MALVCCCASRCARVFSLPSVGQQPICRRSFRRPPASIRKRVRARACRSGAPVRFAADVDPGGFAHRARALARAGDSGRRFAPRVPTFASSVENRRAAGRCAAALHARRRSRGDRDSRFGSRGARSTRWRRSLSFRFGRGARVGRCRASRSPTGRRCAGASSPTTSRAARFPPCAISKSASERWRA